MANVLLIYPKPDENKKRRFSFSLKLLYISSILKDNGHTIVNYIDFSLCDYKEDELYDMLKIADYAIVEIDSFSLKRSSNAQNAEILLENIKNFNSSITTICFGNDISLFYRHIMYADYVLYTYNYEFNILKIINNVARLDYINNFDNLPFPDRKLLSDYIQHGGSINHKPNLMKSTLIQTSRGCLNSCTFCQRKGWQNIYLAHSYKYVLSEFRLLKHNNYINIWISDDNFTFNLKRAKTILNELIKQNISNNMKMSCSSWTKIDKEFLDLAKKANISIMSFGIESADKEIQKFYDKIIDLNKVRYLVSYANNIGLYTIGNFIIGAPMETERTIKRTFDYALNTPFDQINIKILDYMRGSKLFELLPDSVVRNKSHIFASKESGLNNFHLSELKEKINAFKHYFNRTRSQMLKEKMLRYGTPYELCNMDCKINNSRC